MLLATTSIQVIILINNSVLLAHTFHIEEAQLLNGITLMAFLKIIDKKDLPLMGIFYRIIHYNVAHSNRHVVVNMAVL